MCLWTIATATATVFKVLADGSKSTLAILARQGAIALPSSTQAAKIAALVRRLAKR